MVTSRSLAPDSGDTTLGPNGAVAHRLQVEQSERLAPQVFDLDDVGWCVIGNGLSNQTFIRAPEGIVGVDTGSSVEEMRIALSHLRSRTDEPIVAVLYTHFHYVSGTQAVTAEATTPSDLAVVGHAGITSNRARMRSETAPAYSRGVVEQFGVRLPVVGPDSVENVGLGLVYRRPEHSPYTAGFLDPTMTFDEPCSFEVGGLRVDARPAPSDADDSVTYVFPELGLAVQNLMWPAIYNVFAIRGETYRDPQVVVDGLDHLLGLDVEWLVGTHGLPIRGRETIRERTTLYRDSIQFMWDQTVRWANRGATSAQIGHEVVLPSVYDADPNTVELYGLVEHHVRQIRSGLFGFFDGDPANLLPHTPVDRARRLIGAIGGVEAVREQCRDALAENDVRWALELASTLFDRDREVASVDAVLLATVLRTVAARTPSANVRNWCLSRAAFIDGTVDGSGLTRHQYRRHEVLGQPHAETVHSLRVLLIPERCAGLDVHIAVEVGGVSAGLHVRHHVAVPTDGTAAQATLVCSRGVWADLLAGHRRLGEALADGTAVVDGDQLMLQTALSAFDLTGFAG